MSPALTPTLASPDAWGGEGEESQGHGKTAELNKGRVCRTEARQSFDGERRATMLAVCFCGLATPRSEPGLIGDLVPADRRARAVFMLGLPLGLALSFLVSGAIAERRSWQEAFYVAPVIRLSAS